MPGITANLSNPAFAIWEEVPPKSRKSPLGAAGDPGRSAWLSEVIIDHYQEMKKFKLDAQAHIEEKIKLMDTLRDMTASRDKLQDIVWNRTDDPTS